ncbi:hypothetical protein AAMO2058_000667100 [Amorphochlora amoebiformis]
MSSTHAKMKPTTKSLRVTLRRSKRLLTHGSVCIYNLHTWVYKRKSSGNTPLKPQVPPKHARFSRSQSQKVPRNFQEKKAIEIDGQNFWKIPKDFSLAQSVCSYGYFALAPNRWTPAPHGEDEDRGKLSRPFRYANEKVVWATIRQSGSRSSLPESPPNLHITLHAPHELAIHEIQEVMDGVGRMLRVQMCVKGFHEVCPEAKDRGFGRTFRSPCLWEDMVKTITNCNMKWSGTVRMNHLLCTHVGKNGAFPTPKEVLKHKAQWLQENCKLGYRAERIRRLAACVEGIEGMEKLDLQWFEASDRKREEAFERIIKLYGFGKFAAHNVCQLLGYHESFPFDSETVRHFKEHHKASSKAKFTDIEKLARKHYSTFAPYQFLAYWFELWTAYEKRRGSTSTRWTVRGNHHTKTLQDRELRILRRFQAAKQALVTTLDAIREKPTL